MKMQHKQPEKNASFFLTNTKIIFEHTHTKKKILQGFMNPSTSTAVKVGIFGR